MLFARSYGPFYFVLINNHCFHWCDIFGELPLLLSFCRPLLAQYFMTLQNHPSLYVMQSLNSRAIFVKWTNRKSCKTRWPAADRASVWVQNRDKCSRWGKVGCVAYGNPSGGRSDASGSECCSRHISHEKLHLWLFYKRSRRLWVCRWVLMQNVHRLRNGKGSGGQEGRETRGGVYGGRA